LAAFSCYIGIDHGFSFPLRYFEVHWLPPDGPTFLSGIPPLCRTHPMMPNWQQEVFDGNQGKAEIYAGVQA